jgi:hypothetical protein
MLAIVRELELTILELADSPELVTRARGQLRSALREISGLDPAGTGQTLAQAIDQCATAPVGRADAASVVLRCLPVSGLIPENNSDNQIDRRIVTLVRVGAPDIWAQFVGDDRIQTFAAFSKISAVLSTILDQLNHVRTGPAQIDALLANRQRTTSTLNRSTVAAILKAYDAEQIVSRVETIFALLAEATLIESPAFPQRILNLQHFILADIPQIPVCRT